MKYYLFNIGKDGDVHFSQMDKDRAQKEINHLVTKEDAWFFSEFPGQHDPMAWGNKYLLIKGKIITPRKVEVVKRVEIE